MGNSNFKSVCYVHDTILITDSEDNLQKLLHSFNQSAKQLNMFINTDKTKCLVRSKEPVKCKLQVDQRMIEQVNQLKYLGAETASSGNLDSEVREQSAFQISSCLKNGGTDTLKWIQICSKSRNYAAETRPDASKK
ncbi:putative Si dkeyp-35f12.3 [Trypoxylus dichotomus]